MTEYRQESKGLISIRLHEPAECQCMVEHIRRVEGWVPAQVRDVTSGGRSQSLTQPEVRSTQILLSEQAEAVCQPFEVALNTKVKPLIKRVWQIDLADHRDTQILKYGPTDHYVPHQDTGVGFEWRYLSVVCYLNDDFLGGETSFPGLSHTAIPETGKAIVFPSHYLHGSLPVIRGEKFVIVSWLRGPVPIKWI
jgi:predicted 2-oxoglutarate/Fe(II)-dependent dioxygenase YbiX